ncbi:MAG: NAD(P)/FAD-dependent oxidoreductase [Patescibacteria group bacterium]
MTYDLIVIGGGPAGMMAAGRAAELGARVLLLEKNKRLGIKLLTTGNGRCNLTNAISVRDLVKSFGENGKFLFSALSKFTPENVIDFFSERGVEIKIENNNRAFPASDKSIDILNVLIEYLKEAKVEIIYEAPVKVIEKKGNEISKLILVDGRKFFAKNYLITTGGLSYSTTGSTGDGYNWLKGFGHKIIKTYPALAPVNIKESFIEELEGVSLVETKFTWKKNEKVIDSRIGDAIFTGNGLSGPAIFASSGLVARNLPDITLVVDFIPEKNLTALDLMLQDLFSKNKNKQIKNVLADLLVERLVNQILKIAKIIPEMEINKISKNDRQTICQAIKNFSLEVSSVAGYHKAMLTTGGLDLSEVDPKTMRSKIIKNLLVAGEVLDLDGPTGGFNLQACWSTGRLAGENLFIK